MAVDPPSTHHSHLDPSDLRFRLTSRSSYGRKYRSAADPIFNPKEKGEEHTTGSKSCYRCDPSAEVSTDSSPKQVARAETPRRSIHRKRTPEFCSRERDSWKIFPRYPSPEQSPQGKNLDICYPRPSRKQSYLPIFECLNVTSTTELEIWENMITSLKQTYYSSRFNKATLEIDNLDESVKYTAFLQGLRPISKFAFFVYKSPPGGKSTKGSKLDERRPKDPFALENLTPLNAKPSQILHEIKDNKVLQWPEKIRSRPNKRNKDLWCHFHNDHGHSTDNYGSLKRAIKALIKRGQLRNFVAHKEGQQQTPPAIEGREDREENAGTINTISGGLAAGDSKDVKTLHDDPLVITIKAGNFDVKRVLVNNGSSAEVLFYNAFKKMNISTDRLRKMDMPLYGFSNQPVTVEGIIALPVAISTPPMQANFLLDFVVVKAVMSTYHLKMKFPTELGVGEVKEDQTTARQCYMALCQSKNKEALIIEDLREDTKMQRGDLVEELVSIEVYPRKENKTVRIDSNLNEDTKLELVNLLRTYADVFAWTAANMPGIDPEPRGIRKLVNWSVELGEFDIQYKPRTTIKAQVLADFIVECTSLEDPPQLVIFEVPDPWNLYVDGSSAIGSSGARIILISPEGFVVEYALRFGFQVSNNEAECEALLAGIRLAHTLKVDSLSIHSDSHLVVNHVLGDYEARDKRMAQYLQLVRRQLQSLRTSPFVKFLEIRILRQIHYQGSLPSK
ncbi:hypothetical protein RJ639_030136 [Escallonia herrerae]|uniref:RNase H type-1 domain-containing protein n=1 Tax=Escallonia herrerae TaxID=1293975 RepID=A0AA89BDS2_9ASTE|nr:hypothetical protein RJ639_030136 [Escallonia herrerae]